MRGFVGAAICVAIGVMSGCATVTPPTTAAINTATGETWRLPNDPKEAPWQPVHIRFKTPTAYNAATVEGKPCVMGEANASWSLLGAKIPPEQANASTLSWRWHVPSLVPEADGSSRDKDDAPVRVLIAFKGDYATLDAVDRSAMNMAKLIGGWEVPFASIQYLWEHTTKPDTVIHHHTISRIKKIVARTGSTGLGSWVDVVRDVRADYRLAFNGEEPGEIESIALMTDTDTMHGQTRGCYANVSLK